MKTFVSEKKYSLFCRFSGFLNFPNSQSFWLFSKKALYLGGTLLTKNTILYAFYSKFAIFTGIEKNQDASKKNNFFQKTNFYFFFEENLYSYIFEKSY